MTVTAIGPVLDRDGLSSAREDFQVRAWSIPCDGVRRIQAPKIIVDVGHDGRAVGEVVDLQLRNRHLWVAAHLNVEPPEWAGPWYWSGLIDSRERDGGDAIIQAVSLTPYPRQTGLRPLAFYPGDLKFRRSVPDRWQVSGLERELLTRAASNLFHRDRGPIVVDDPPDLPDGKHPAEIAQALEDEFWKYRPLRYRPSRIIDVR